MKAIFNGKEIETGVMDEIQKINGKDVKVFWAEIMHVETVYTDVKMFGFTCTINRGEKKVSCDISKDGKVYFTRMQAKAAFRVMAAIEGRDWNDYNKIYMKLREGKATAGNKEKAEDIWTTTTEDKKELTGNKGKNK